MANLLEEISQFNMSGTAGTLNSVPGLGGQGVKIGTKKQLDTNAMLDKAVVAMQQAKKAKQAEGQKQQAKNTAKANDTKSQFFDFLDTAPDAVLQDPAFIQKISGKIPGGATAESLTKLKATRARAKAQLKQLTPEQVSKMPQEALQSLAQIGITDPQKLATPKWVQDLQGLGKSVVKGAIGQGTAKPKGMFGAFAESNKVADVLDKDKSSIINNRLWTLGQNKANSSNEAQTVSFTDGSKFLINPEKQDDSKRFVQGYFNIETGKRVKPIELRGTDPSNIGVGFYKEENGEMVLQTIAPKLTPEQSAELSRLTAERKQLDKEVIKDNEESKDVFESINNTGEHFLNMRNILKDIPAGYVGSTKASFDTWRDKLGLGANETSMKVAEFNTMKTTLANFARSVGKEKGVLSDQDISRAMLAFPLISDSKSQRIGKLKTVQKLLNTSIKNNSIKNKIPDYRKHYINLMDVEMIRVTFKNEKDFNEYNKGGAVPIGTTIIINGSPAVWD